MADQIVQLLQDRYFAGATHHARASFTGGVLSYFPIEGVPSDQDIQDHLRGEIVLGAYTLLPDSTCRWFCLDVDSDDQTFTPAENKQLARNITGEIAEKLEAIDHAVEWSAGKGYHVWVYLTKPMPASEAKAFGISVREAIGVSATGSTHVEIFPKQDRLDKDSSLGNLVKLPLGLHPVTRKRSCFVDVSNGWEDGPILGAEAVLLKLVDPAGLGDVLGAISPINRLASLLAPFYVSGERHNLTLALAGLLAGVGWAKDEVESLVSSLIDQVGGEPENLLECVTDTYKRLATGKSIQGFSGLAERLPVNVLRQISELAGQNIAEPIMQMIDATRMDKGPPHIKVRQVSHSCLVNLTETGRFIYANNAYYWLNYATHTLINCLSTDWFALCLRRFGLNNQENFAKQVFNNIMLTAHDRAERVKVHKRFFYDGGALWLNFGGPEVYRLCGDKNKREVHYNGENGMFFVNDDSADLTEEMGNVNLLDISPLDPWEYITNDLSFAPGTSNTATNEQQQQLLRAWVLQIFFGNMLPTRPLLLFVGPRGSGKTTAARRLLRFIEGTGQDVLGIVNDKEDSLRASIQSHLVLVLDNLEKTRVTWLDNILNRLATGAQLELRNLYKTNEKYVIKPDCFVMLTGISVPSNEEALYSRILPLEMTPLGKIYSEQLMQSKLKDNLAGLWAGMFDQLDLVIAALHTNQGVVITSDNRLADFSVFCNRIKDSGVVDRDLLMTGLQKLTQSQNSIMSRNSGAIEALETWLSSCTSLQYNFGHESDPTIWRTHSELFHLLHRVASQNHLKGFIWTTPTGFTRHWLLLIDAMPPTFGMKIQEVKDTVNGGKLKQYCFTPQKIA